MGLGVTAATVAATELVCSRGETGRKHSHFLLLNTSEAAAELPENSLENWPIIADTYVLGIKAGFFGPVRYSRIFAGT